MQRGDGGGEPRPELIPNELQSKLLRGSCIGDDIGD